MNQFIIHFHSLKTNEKTRIDFKSEKPSSDFIEMAKLKGYCIYQYIQNDYTYNMSIPDLKNENVEFEILQREKKTWFGLSKKIITDFLIKPKKDFYYPYQYGHYLYIFTKKEIDKTEFENWLNKEFPNRFGDIDETFTDFDKLLNKDDFLIATNHDYQYQFGVIGKRDLIERIISNYKTEKLKDFEIESYDE